MKVIFDSDMLGDDFFALSAIAENKDIELLGVTTFGRITPALNRAKMAQVFLDRKGAKGISIIPGADRPLLQEPKKGCMYCNNELMGLLKEWDSNKAYDNKLISDISAAEFIAATLRKEKNVTLLCTGPFTNIALALSIAPEIAESVDRVVMMAGVHYEQGNKSPVAESNIFNDADAAKIVLRAFKNVEMVPLDVTLRFCITEEDADINVNEFFRSVSLSCCRSHLDRGDDSIMPMHDYLAYLAMIDDSILTYDRCDLEVDNSGSKTRGMLVFNWNENGAVKYAVNLDIAKAMEYYRKDFVR